MTPDNIIREAFDAGINLALTDAGTIKAIGDPVAVNRLAPAIRAHRNAIILRLRESERQMTAILAWLRHIGETDPAIIAEMMGKCRADPEARNYFVGRSPEMRGANHGRS